jgi:hypothetical protein
MFYKTIKEGIIDPTFGTNRHSRGMMISWASLSWMHLCTIMALKL